ncbi:Molybdate-anion transporter [Galdieria sulphuraria]|nr:Molybdate-anion transporter [Galdieria sulphuraria]
MFWLYFVSLSLLCIIARVYIRLYKVSQVSKEIDSENFEVQGRKLQGEYLIVYLLAVSADWLQGPYVYALYEQYGFSKAQIGFLFVAGFGSSGIFGTFVGSSADRFGRKRLCLVYGLLYSISCITKHFPIFTILLLGRLLGGISTSILFSSFESWLISEHNKRLLPGWLLNEIFAKAQFGNASNFGKVAPFDASILILFIMSLVIYMKWDENYGDNHKDSKVGFHCALQSLFAEQRIWLLGVFQSCFESVMYIFVFMWTPALQLTSSTNIPHGLVFSCFMVALMLGSCTFTILEGNVEVVQLLRICFIVTAIVFLVTISSSVLWIVFFSFVLFETICGVFFPSMAVLRARTIPNEYRSTIMNLYRVPLNFIVLVVLLADWSVSTTFERSANLSRKDHFRRRIIV